GGYLMDVDISRVQKTWDVNLLGPLLWARAAVKVGLKESILNVASVGGIKPASYMGAYNISKAGLIYMTKQLAKELAPNIRVNGIAPAVVKTKLSEMLWENDEQATADLHALKKLGTPEDISNLMYFLSSEEASWITGEVVTIDGGYLL
ncbi:MAG: SDR family oxidoreductase, partial [Actinobacteria bacterium]|nr:SDR family oxidoreductase [Actinomycetota bacterium]